MATIVGDTGRCVVPNTLPRKPESFLSLYYGHQASLNKYRGTTGQNVDLTLLSSEKLLSQVSEQNSFLRSERKGLVNFPFLLFVSLLVSLLQEAAPTSMPTRKEMLMVPVELQALIQSLRSLMVMMTLW